MFNLNISICSISVTKSHYQTTGDSTGKIDSNINKGIGFTDVMKRLEKKMAPYMFIINLIQAVSYVCALIL